MDIVSGTQEQLHKFMDLVEKHIDQNRSSIVEMNKRLDGLNGKADVDEIQVMRDSMVKYNETLAEHRSRLDNLDKALPTGSKVYQSVVPSQTARDMECRKEIAKMILDNICIRRNEGPRFGSEYFSRTQIENTLADGGYLFNEEFRGVIMRVAEQYGVARQLCRIIPMSAKEWVVPTNSDLPTVTWDTQLAGGVKELIAPSQTKATFSQGTMTAHKLIAIDTISVELSQDSIPDIMGFILDLFAIAIAKEEDYQCFISDGSGTQPFTGLLKLGGITEIVGADNTYLGCLKSTDDDQGGYASLVRTYDAVDESTANTGTWVMSNSILNGMRTVRDTVGQPLFQGISGVANAEAFGRPIVRSRVFPKMKDGGSQASSPFLLFGDFQYQLMGDRMQLSFDASPHAAFKEAGTVLRVMERVAFMNLFTSPFARFVTGA